MNWKTRQLFSDQEHGIVSGLSPVNMTGGGNVPYPSYQEGGLFGRRKGRKAEYTPSQALLAPAQAGAMMGGTASPLAEYINAARTGAMAGGTEAAQELSIEQQVAALAAQQGISVPEARVMILLGMIEGKGITLSNEILNQYATGLITLQDALSQATPEKEEASYEAPSWKEIWERDISNPAYDNNPVTDKLRYPLSAVSTPVQKGMLETFELLGIDPENAPKMQTGGLALDLFERGDQDINEPLNMMAQAVSPPLSDVGPTEKVEETVTVTEDQGPSDTEAGKAPFQQMAVEVVKEATMSLAREDYMNIEQVQQDVEQQLNAIDETYRQQTGATDTILTEEFLAQLDNLMVNAGEAFDTAPGMEDGGNVYDINTLITSMAGKGVDPVKIQEIIKKYYPGGTGMSDEMLQNRISRARRSALLGGKTKQGGWAGMMDILGQADDAEVAAMGSMPETLATNEAALKRLAMTGELEAAGGVGAGGVTADAKKMLMMQTIMSDPNMPQDMKDILLKGLAGLKPGKEQKIDLIKSFINGLPNEQRERKKIVGTEKNPTPQEIAAWAARLADAILGSLSGEQKREG